MDHLNKVKQSLDDVLKGVQENYKPFMLRKEEDLPQHQGSAASENVLAEIIQFSKNKLKQDKKETSAVDSTEESQEVLTPQIEGGESTMKKNCYKRKDGRWEYSKRQNGFKYYAIANTYRELLEEIKNIEPKRVKNVTYVKLKNCNTFVQYFQMYINNYVKTKSISRETKLDWENTLNKHITPCFTRMPIDKITAEQLQTFIYKIKAERTREVTYQRIVKVMQKAYVTGKIKRDITLALERPKRQNFMERFPLTLEEQKAVLEKAKKSEHYVFYMFSIIVGSRREETVKFNIKTDLDEEKGIIHIRGTKTKNADRKVYVTQAFIQLLKENLKCGRFRHHPTTYTKGIKDIFVSAGVDSCLHALRHTCAANLYFLGAKDKYRQMQLGHASIVTTNDIYTNIKENIAKASLREIYGDLYPRFDETFDETFDTK